MIETERLILRAFKEHDREAFAAMNADRRVGDWVVGGVLTREQSDATLERVNANIFHNGFDFWAVERKADQQLIGMIGMRCVKEVPPGPCIELGWRLAPHSWGSGFASEGAKASLEWGFANLKVSEIYAFASRANVRSLAVMERIGMVALPDRSFDHPGFRPGHPLRAYVVSVARA